MMAGGQTMESRCTCGRPLPDEAAFCMYCGRPRDGVAEEPPEAARPRDDEEGVVVVAESKPRIPTLLWATAIPALTATLLRLVMGFVDPGLGLLSLIVIGSAGYYAVRIYENRAAMRLTTSLGCGLGALTGMTCSVISLAVQASALAAAGGVDAFVERIHREVDTHPLASELSGLLADPTFMAMFFAAGLFVEVLFLVAFATAGGLIAAKVRRTRAV